ncbi:hypothetical protein K9L16_01220 [Candidatus Pacearchaeota archaeon]|nr:hypothetical protein [Candidatus Pacearchaeota archaeon]
MKIAIASDSGNVNEKISERAGRAKYYLIFENKSFKEKLENPFALSSGGAGWEVPEFLVKEKIDLVIAGKFGENMKNALIKNKIKFKEINGIISDFLKER